MVAGKGKVCAAFAPRHLRFSAEKVEEEKRGRLDEVMFGEVRRGVRCAG